MSLMTSTGMCAALLLCSPGMAEEAFHFTNASSHTWHLVAASALDIATRPGATPEERQALGQGATLSVHPGATLTLWLQELKPGTGPARFHLLDVFDENPAEVYVSCGLSPNGTPMTSLMRDLRLDGLDPVPDALTRVKAIGTWGGSTFTFRADSYTALGVSPSPAPPTQTRAILGGAVLVAPKARVPVFPWVLTLADPGPCGEDLEAPAGLTVAAAPGPDDLAS